MDGFGREWDYPLPRIWKEPVTSGPTKGKSISKEDIEKLLAMYYEQRGWTKNGSLHRKNWRKWAFEG